MHAEQLLCLMHIAKLSKPFHPSTNNVILHLAAKGKIQALPNMELKNVIFLLHKENGSTSI